MSRKRKAGRYFFIIQLLHQVIFRKSLRPLYYNYLDSGSKSTIFSLRIRLVRRKMDFINKVFQVTHDDSFNETALAVFQFQYRENEIYRRYVDSIGRKPERIKQSHEIPFLPVSFFKTQRILSGAGEPVKIFRSSGTTGSERSSHHVLDLSVYSESLIKGFELFYGALKDYEILALTPGPAIAPDSSLVYMISQWIGESGSESSGFYLDQQEQLAELLVTPGRTGKKTLLIGLSYALVDFAERFPLSLPGTVIMETGGMKGRRKEMIREELHDLLTEKFRCRVIHSEYGMTELLSQAYSKENGLFKTVPWMKILVREPADPFELLPNGKTGGINIIDLANFNSCSFIATQDLGRANEDGTFEVLGRFDFSDLRGCNLMAG